MNIKTAESDNDLRHCFPVMKQLRPHLTENDYLTRVKRQQEKYGYTTVFLEDRGEIKAVSGFRVYECLCDGKYLYIDEKVCDENNRSKGYGDKLFDWIVDYARNNGCNKIGLESGVQRFGAHRFYFRKRMKISSHHFCLPLDLSESKQD